MPTTQAVKPVRLNLGSGELPLEGWTNVDSHCPADVQGDIRKLDFADVAEVNMSHVLEHLSYHDVIGTLERIRSWMQPGAKITIEVPDMRKIGPGIDHPLWVVYTYGAQSHPGEFHRSGFTAESLAGVLKQVRFREVAVRAFASEHHYRPGMPCIEATAVA